MTSKDSKLPGAVGPPRTGQGTSSTSPEESEAHSSNDKNPPSSDDTKSRPEKATEDTRSNNTSQVATSVKVPTKENGKQHETGVASAGLKPIMIHKSHENSNLTVSPSESNAFKPSKIPRPTNNSKRQSEEKKSPNAGIAIETRKMPDSAQTRISRSRIPVPIGKLRNGNSATSGLSSSDSSDLATGKHQIVTSSTERKGNLTSSKDEPSPSKNPSLSSTSSDGGKYMPKNMTSSISRVGKSTLGKYENVSVVKSTKSPRIRNGMPKSGLPISCKIGKSDTPRLALKNVTSPATKSGKPSPNKAAKAPPAPKGKASYIRDQSVSSSSSENAIRGLKTLPSSTVKRQNSRPAQNRYLDTSSDESSRQNPTFPPVKCRNTPPTKAGKVPEIKTGERRPLRAPSISSSSSGNASRILMDLTSPGSKDIKNRKPKCSSSRRPSTDCFGCMKNTSSPAEKRKPPPRNDAKSRTVRAELSSTESDKTRKSRVPMHSSTAKKDAGPMKNTPPGKDNRTFPPAKVRGFGAGSEKHRAVENERSLPLGVPSAPLLSSECESETQIELTSNRGKSGKSKLSSTPQPETDFGCMRMSSSQSENREMPSLKDTISKGSMGGMSTRRNEIHQTCGRAWPSISPSSSDNESRAIMDKASPTGNSKESTRFVSPECRSGGFDHSDETSPHIECRMSPRDQDKRDTTRAEKCSIARKKPQQREYEVSWPLKVPSASSSSSENESIILMEITSPTGKRGKGRHSRRLTSPDPDVGCFDCMSETSWQLAKEKAVRDRYRHKDERPSSENRGCLDCLGVKSPRAKSAQANIAVYAECRTSSSSASDTTSPIMEDKKPTESGSNAEQFSSARVTSSPTSITKNPPLKDIEKSPKQTSDAQEKLREDISESLVSNRRDIPTPGSREESLSGSCEKAPSDEHERPLSHTREKYSPDRRERRSAYTSEETAAKRDARPPSGSSKAPPLDTGKKPLAGRNEKSASPTTDESSFRRPPSVSSSSSDSEASRILMEITSPTHKYRKRHVTPVANFSSVGRRKHSPRKDRPSSSPSPHLTHLIPDCIKPTKGSNRELRPAKETAQLSSNENVREVVGSVPEKGQSSTLAKLIRMMSNESLSAAQPSTPQGRGKSASIERHAVKASTQTDNTGSSDDLTENEDYSRKGLRIYSPRHCDLSPRSSCMKISETPNKDCAQASAEKEAQLSKNKGKANDNLSMRPSARHGTNVKEKGEVTADSKPSKQRAEHHVRRLEDGKVSRTEAVSDLTQLRDVPETPANSPPCAFPATSPEHRYNTTFQADYFRPREIFDDDSTPDMRAVEWVAKQCELNEARRQARRHPVPTPRGRSHGNHRESSAAHRVNDPHQLSTRRAIARAVMKCWRRAKAWLTRCCSCEADLFVGQVYN